MKLIQLCILALLLSGCATVSHVPLQKEERLSIKTVKINPNISKPKDMYQLSRQENVSGSLMGVAGVLLDEHAEKNARLAFQRKLEENHIDIRDIVYSQMHNQLASKRIFNLANSQADAELKIDIAQYGYSSVNAFSSDYTPILFINAKLVKNNKIIWQDGEYAFTFSSGNPHFKFEEIQNNPKELGKLWDKVASNLVAKMIADLNHVA